MDKRTTVVNTLLLMLVMTTFSQLVLLQVYAIDVKIIFISPVTKTGKVGETVTLIGTINTTDGMYEVLFNNKKVAWGFASGNSVNCSFTVPSLPGGNYTVTLRDVNASIDSSPSWFYVKTDYVVKVDKPHYPRQFQEGATTINISVSITGGRANTPYIANITVKTPANETYRSLVQINTTETGVGSLMLRYPEDFGGKAHTNYTGTYTVYFNGTLASDTFFIGLTDQAEYHRGDTVKIKAVGYLSLNGKNVTITIRLRNESVATFNYTVQGDVIETSWLVPSCALLGNYSLSITPKPNVKTVNDTQFFAIPGFKVKIVPRSLANETVANAFIKVYDHGAGKTYNVTSDANGVANIWLEKGNHTFTAYFKKVRVGEALFDIPYVYDELNLACQLTNLNVTVVSEQNAAVKIPFVSLNLTATYKVELDGGKNENETIISKTDINGSAQFRLLFPNATYKIAASRYGRVFNMDNATISKLESKAWNNINILCPVKQLTVNLIDASNTPIPNALVEIQEIMGGLYSASYTNSNGQSFFNCVFGVYNIKVSKGVVLNTTKVEIFEEKTVTVRCSLYNLPIYVKVVDYFGQPVSNANVTLEREGVRLSSKLTGANGIADFTEIGGNLTIRVYLTDRNLLASFLTCTIDGARAETNPIVVKLNSYVVFAGFLVETAWFTTFILIGAALVFFVLLEVARRKRLKIQASKS